MRYFYISIRYFYISKIIREYLILTCDLIKKLISELFQIFIFKESKPGYRIIENLKF